MAEDGSDATLGVACLVAVLAVLVALVVAVLKMSKSGEAEEEAAAPRQRPRQRGALDRMQRGAAAAADDEDEDDDDNDVDAGRAGRKNAKKAADKEARRAEQQAAREANQQRQEQVSKKAEKYNAKLAAKEAERLAKEEEERKAREEKEKKEQEEFDNWKDMFAVEASGEADANDGESSLLERFVDFIKTRKMVNLEDLAAHFQMRTSVAIDRLQELEKIGRITGIFDDRGKYIYVTSQEMTELTGWLKRKGRINRTDLVAACNKAIRLNPTEEDEAKIKEEARSAMAALDAEEEKATA